MDNLSTFLLIRQMFNLKSIADILLIASILFLLYRTLLRLGTWKIVAGIGLAMLFFFLASVFDLHGIEWIYNNLSPVAVIALIVIFQPELRKIFERAASMRRIKTSDPGDELPQLISEALITLSEQKRGAIIVLPGREPLREWVAGGFAIDAKPSFPLVMSIFDPNSPGHDGALFVRNGKLSHFGVRLPISQTAKLPPELGTRHHAAMGLAEKSDALVLVVSEERGTISVFKNAACSIISERKQIKAAICDHWNQMAAFPVDIPTFSIRWPAFFRPWQVWRRRRFSGVPLRLARARSLKKPSLSRWRTQRPHPASPWWEIN
jgi:diadenylate cyclase